MNGAGDDWRSDSLAPFERWPPIKRPLAWIAAALVAGTFAGARHALSGVALPGALCLAGLALMLLTRRRPRWLALGVILAFGAAGALLWNARHFDPPGDSLARVAARQPESERYLLEGTVQRPDILLPDGDYMQFILRVHTVGYGGAPVPLDGGVLVRWTRPGFQVHTGDHVRVEGPLDLAISRVNPGVKAAEAYYRRRGVHTVLRIRGPDAVERISPGAAWSPAYWASRLRTAQAARLSAVIPESSLPFVLTVWLGDRRRITDETYTGFLESGTAHILAVSGVHIGIIFVTLVYLLRLLIRNRRARILVTMAAVLLFALVAGARVSSLRAAIMILLYLAADWFDREPDAPTAISIAAILFTLHDPDVVFDTGFELSFLSVASILLFHEPIRAHFKRLPRLARDGLSLTLAVQVLPLPLAVSFFHVLPIAGVLINLIIVPLLSLVLWLCLLVTASTVVFEPFAVIFAHATHGLVQAILWIAKSVSALGVSYRYLVSPAPIAIIAYWVAAGLLFVALSSTRRRWAWTCGVFVAIATATFLWQPRARPPEITVLDVGHGDATFVRAPGGATLLVDAGDDYGLVDMGRRVVAPFLWANHESRLDAVLVTHSDRDHIGGIAYIIDHFPVGVVLLGPRPSNTPLEQALLAQCAERGVPVRRVSRGDRIRLGEAAVEVLHPPRDWPDDSSANDASVTLRIAWPGFSVLLPGDVEAGPESLLARMDCAAAVLKVPHHGSRTSSTDVFIDAVRPRLAIISVGPRGRRSVLSSAVLDRYRARGITVLRTDTVGGVRIVSGEANPSAQAERVLRGYPIRGAR